MKRGFAHTGIWALALTLAMLCARMISPAAPALASPGQPESPTIQKTLVLLIGFNNVAFENDDAYWRDRMFSETGVSVRHYYDEATYGKHRFAPAEETFGTGEEIDDGVVHVTLDEPHPGGGGVAETWGVAECIMRAIEEADDHVDFASFDVNGDGLVTTDELHITAVLAGYDSSDSRTIGRPAMRAHANYDGLRDCSVDGVTLTTYIAQGEIINETLGPIGIGTICHELGHSLGLPDLYDQSGSSIGLGTSSLMASGCNLSGGEAVLGGSSPAHFDPWSLIEIGARTPQVVTQDATVTLHASDTPEYNIVKVPITDDGRQYFLLENRVTEGYDKGLRDDPFWGGAISGVAIYHVDEWVMDTYNVATYGVLPGVNSNHLRKGVDLEEADGPTLDRPWDSPHGGDHYFYEGGQTVFAPDTYPDTGAYVDTLTTGVTKPSGVRIEISGESGSPQMQARITFGCTATPSGFAGGDGSIGSPYQIMTKSQLDMVRRHAGSHFVLADDLVFTPEDFAAGGAFHNNGKGFRPLFAGSSFKGTFDGAGHKITGLRVNASGLGDTYAGLFGTLSGTVKDLTLVEATIEATSANGRSYAGGIAGKAFLGLIKGCAVSGSVTGDYAGGIVGTAAGSDVKGCRNGAAIRSNACYQDGLAGGIAGEAFRTSVTRCSNEGGVAVRSTRSTAAANGFEMLNAGGIVGQLAGHGFTARVSQCFNAGAVTAARSESELFWGWSEAGGIVGWARSDAATSLLDCYNIGAVSGMLAGGIVGEAQGPTIARCYSVGALADDDGIGSLGGIAGRAYSDLAERLTDCFFLQTDGHPEGVAYWYGEPVAEEPTTPCTHEAMQTEDAFAGFDFGTVWLLEGASGYPYPQLRAHRQALTQPGVPTLTASAAGYDAVKLTWSAAANATDYELSRATAAGGPYMLVTSTRATSLTDTDLATGTTYFYKVRAVASEGGLTVQGSESAVADATPALAKVASLTLKKASKTSIKATWKAVPGASGYQLHRAKGAKGKFVLVKTTKALSFTDKSLARKTTYRYRVRAYRLVGAVEVFGGYSAVAKRAL